MSDGPTFRGGQGKSFLAEPISGGPERVFIKTIDPRRRRQDAARKRFKREAAAYDTLRGLGPPELIEDNSGAWDDPSKPVLYMVLEYVPGPTLREYLDTTGPLAQPDVLEFLRVLSGVLNSCHQNEFLHRDIKPLNIVLREGSPTSPVLVDFGLSFNDESEDDLTRVGEEVGNRFLRLPEHSLGGRYPASDVTQLAGVVLFMLTGVEPRVLIDENNRMPHQRLDVRSHLETRFHGRQLFRVMRVFDRAFTQDVSKRFRTATELFENVKQAMTDADGSTDDLTDLEARLDELTAGRNLRAVHEVRRKLDRFLSFMDNAVVNYAESQGLERSVTGWNRGGSASEQWASSHLAMTVPGEPAAAYVVFKVEERTAEEFEAFADGQEVWRGQSPDSALNDAVKRAVITAFLASHEAKGP